MEKLENWNSVFLFPHKPYAVCHTYPPHLPAKAIFVTGEKNFVIQGNIGKFSVVKMSSSYQNIQCS